MGLWLSQVPAPDENKTIAASDYRFYRSANRGVAGVVYFLARFSRNGLFSQELKDRADTAIDWLLAHHPTSDDQLPGLHFGEAGVALAVAEAIAPAGLIERGPWFDEYLTEALGGPDRLA